VRDKTTDPSRYRTTRVIEIHKQDKEGNDLTDSVKALEYAKQLARERSVEGKREWEILVVQQTK